MLIRGYFSHSTNIPSFRDCPSRDNMLVENKIRFNRSPVRDEIYFNRTIVNSKVKMQIAKSKIDVIYLATNSVNESKLNEF